MMERKKKDKKDGKRIDRSEKNYGGKKYKRIRYSVLLTYYN